MNRVNRLATLAVALALSSPAFATTSTVNPSVPAQNSPLSSSVIRNGIALPAYNDLNGLLAASSSGSITSITGDITCSGTSSVTCALSNTSTARSDLGLGTSATANIGTSGATIGMLNGALTFGGADKFNLNTGGLPVAQTGTVIQLGNADTVPTRIELDSFGAGGHFTAARSDGTSASPTAVLANDLLGSFNADGHNGSAIIGPQGSFQIFANQNWSVGANGTYATISTTPNGSTTLTPVLKFENDGGTTTPGAVGGSKGVGTINVNGVYSTALGATNTGYAGYFANTSTASGAEAIYASGPSYLGGFTTIAGGATIAPVALTVSASAFATNAALSNYFYVTLPNSTSTTASAPTNPTDGQIISYELSQNGTGSGTVSWNSVFDFGAGGTPTITTTASKIDILAFRYSARNTKWNYLGSQLGF